MEQGDYVFEVRRHEVARKSLLLRQKKAHIYLPDNVCFFQRNKSLVGFVKCTSCVKYASRVKCAAAREGIYFISHRTK